MKLAWGLKRPEAEWIKTDAQMKKLVRLCQNTEVLAYDTETTGVDISVDRVIFWSVSTGPDRYFLEADRLHDFKPVLDDPDKIYIGSQIKFDFHMTANSGYPITGNMMDTLVMDRLLDPDQDHGLKEAYEREFNERVRTFPETFYPKDAKGRFRKPSGKSLQEIMLDAWDRDPERVIDYASLDAWGVYRLFRQLRKRIKQVKTARGYNLWDLFLGWEVPMTKVLYQMERNGCLLDLEYLGKIEPILEKQLADLNWQLNKMIGQAINPGSPKQLVKLFYGKMELEPVAWTSGGSTGKKSPSLNETAMKQHAEDGVEEAQLILQYRELSKLLGTYVVGLVNRADKHGRVHTTLNQHVADTARLSSRDPALQNIPRFRKDFDIRSAFIAPPGMKIIVSDYDQLEMFILADLSKDKGLINNILAGRDIHTGNVELVWGEPYDDVAAAKENKDDKSDRACYLRDLRNKIKVICFGLNYGKHSNSLARELGFFDRIEKEHPDWSDWDIQRAAKAEAQELIDIYFSKIPGAAEFIKGTYRRVAHTKYVETFLGRRRWLRQIMDLDEKEAHQKYELQRSRGKRDTCWCNNCKASREGERRSANSIIQGCLPASTRILTKDGILPIGDLPQCGSVWTGQKWASYKKLNRGKCDLAEIKLDNGQALKCDTRHEVLTVSNQCYKFKKWSSLERGDRVCLSMARVQESGSPLIETVHGYWVGFSIGNGCTAQGKSHRNALSVTFGDRKGRYNKQEKAQEFINFMNLLGYQEQKPRRFEGRITVTFESSNLRRLWETEWGYPWGCTAHYKSVPAVVWSSPPKVRASFLIGLMDADGYIGGNSPALHMCNEGLLREAQILARTVGVESRLHGPYNCNGYVSWRLDFNGAHLAVLGYGKRKREISFDRAPRFVVKQYITAMTNKKVEQGSDATLLRRMRSGGSTSVYTLRRLAKKYEVDLQLYASAKVVTTQALGVEETTYTLSVNDPDHRFDSEGVISKNTAADIVMCAMIKCHYDNRLRRLGVKMLLQIHDELVFECPDENIEEACPIIQYNMEHPGINMCVPLRATPGVGDNWGSGK